MSSRHQRRKRAKLRKANLLIGEAQAEWSRNVAKTVKRNLSQPVGETVILTDRFGIRRKRKASPYSFAPSSVEKVGVASVSGRGLADKGSHETCPKANRPATYAIDRSLTAPILPVKKKR